MSFLLTILWLETYPKEDCILRIWLTWHSVCVIWQSGLTSYPFSSMYFSYSDFENVTGDSNDIDSLFFVSGEVNKTPLSSGILYLTNMLLITPSDRSLSLRDMDATVSSPFWYNWNNGEYELNGMRDLRYHTIEVISNKSIPVKSNAI